MTVQRMDHVAINVDDLQAAIDFFAELGLELEGQAALEGSSVDRIVGLERVRTNIAMMRVPGNRGRVELVKFHSPPSGDGAARAPANALGIRHLTFAVTDLEDVLVRLRPHGVELVGEVVQYENSYRLCYVRGPEGIIIELAEEIGPAGDR